MTAKDFKKFLPCRFTESAVHEIVHTIQAKNIPSEYRLRVGMKGGGCSGMGFVIGFDLPNESDEVFNLPGFTLLIEKKHIMYLTGVEIDFEDGVNARGFIFRTETDS